MKKQPRPARAAIPTWVTTLLGVRPPKRPEVASRAAAPAARLAKAAPDRDRQHLVQAAVRAHRDRCAAIVAHGIKVGAVRQACALAFDTSMSAHVAIATLNATLRDPGPTRPNPRSSTEPAGAVNSLVQQILAAGAMARGEA